MRRLACALALLALLALPLGSRAAEAPGLVETNAPPLVLHHAPDQQELANMLASLGPGEVTRIALTLGIPIPNRIDVYVVPQRSGDPRALGLPGAPDWAAGYALVDRPEIVLRSTIIDGPTGNDAATVFTHELVHSLVSQALGARRDDELPAWFREGLASHLAYEWRLVHSAHAAGLALSGPTIPLRTIESGFPLDSSRAQLAYLESFAYLDWLTDRSGEDALRRLMDRYRAGASFDDAFRESFGAPWSELERQWLPGFLLRYRWAPILTSSATLWILATALFVVGGILKRRRTRAILQRWEQEELLLEPSLAWPQVALAPPEIDEAAPEGGEPIPSDAEPRA